MSEKPRSEKSPMSVFDRAFTYGVLLSDGSTMKFENGKWVTHRRMRKPGDDPRLDRWYSAKVPPKVT